MSPTGPLRQLPDTIHLRILSVSLNVVNIGCFFFLFKIIIL